MLMTTGTLIAIAALIAMAFEMTHTAIILGGVSYFLIIRAA